MYLLTGHIHITADNITQLHIKEQLKKDICSSSSTKGGVVFFQVRPTPTPKVKGLCLCSKISVTQDFPIIVIGGNSLIIAAFTFSCHQVVGAHLILLWGPINSSYAPAQHFVRYPFHPPYRHTNSLYRQGCFLLAHWGPLLCQNLGPPEDSLVFWRASLTPHVIRYIEVEFSLFRIIKTLLLFSKNSATPVHMLCLVLQLSFIEVNRTELQHLIQSTDRGGTGLRKPRPFFLCSWTSPLSLQTYILISFQIASSYNIILYLK